MSHNLRPIPARWYRHLDKGQLFRVVNVEENDRSIEIQHFDGDVEQLDPMAWAEMDLEESTEPEDWTGPLDDVETDDLGYAETAMTQRDWQAPLEANPEPPEAWESDTDEDERDEWGEGDSAEELYGADPDSRR